MATIQFWGAAQEVTGSCHMLEAQGLGRVLLDCGMRQGSDIHKSNERFRFSPHDVDAVILSHAHLDHSGSLPRLVHEGFNGPIYCTDATADLLPIMLLDAWGLYQRDLEKDNLSRRRKNKPELEALYTEEDVRAVFQLIVAKSYDHPFTVGDSAQVCFFDAGHILGSAIVQVQFQEKGQRKTLVFSGDLGKKDTVLMNDPFQISQADVVLMEGTYGDREHKNAGDTKQQFCDVLHQAWERGGNVLIPAFAVGRTQELLHYLALLHRQGELDNWQIFLDSPMAIEVTKVFDDYLNTLNQQDLAKVNRNDSIPLEKRLPNLHLTVSPEQSMAINNVKNGAIIIAGSGMCNGGRIRHHFKQRIWESRNTLLFVGFQAQGTLGRILVDGIKTIKLFGEQYAVRAQIETIGGFSAHAGQSELIEWVSAIDGQPSVILVHGEANALDALSDALWQRKQICAQIPYLGQKRII